MTERPAYARAGVDVAAGERAVELLRAQILAFGRPSPAGNRDFGAVIELPDDLRQPMLVTATDGVGTKTELCRRLGRLETIGQDLVAMCADDVVCHGAQPTYFLDYVAVGRVEPDRVAEIVGGVARACESIGCTLVGGETAEHPGLMADDAFDLAGFCIGFVERDELIDSSAARVGDAIIGLASSGLHANGYSLIRALLDDGKLRLEDSFRPGSSVGDELLTPTRLYSVAILELAADLRRRRLRIGGLAHITGGGLPGNLPRAVGMGLGVRVRPASWSMPQIFREIAQRAGMDDSEMRATFNCGIGFAAVVEPAAAETAIELLTAHRIDAWVLGEVRPINELHGARYVEAA